MSRLFLEDGESIPVTAVSVCGNFVVDIKTKEKNGYNALVVSKTNKSNNLKTVSYTHLTLPTNREV